MLCNVHISGIFRNRSLYLGFFVNFIYSNKLLFTDNLFVNILPENWHLFVDSQGETNELVGRPGVFATHNNMVLHFHQFE